MLIRSAVKVVKSADAAEFLHSHVAISEGNVTRGGAAVGGRAKVSVRDGIFRKRSGSLYQRQ